MSRPRAVAEAPSAKPTRPDVGNDASADCRASMAAVQKDIIAPQASGGGDPDTVPESPSAGTAADTAGAVSAGDGDTGADGSSTAASVVSSEEGDSTGFGAGTGVSTGSSAAGREAFGASALPVMM